MKIFKYLFNSLLDFLVPPTCIYCKKYRVDPHAVCKDCYMKLDFINEPSCKDCGAPLPFDNSFCVSCLGTLNQSKQYDEIDAIFNYDEFSKGAILALKHGNATYIAKFFANIMYKKYKNKFDTSDLVVYVPIHFKRLFQRHYNQTALIARHLNKFSDIKVSHNNLIRIKNTVPQQGNIKKRIRNVKNAFMIRNEKEIEGKNIILIDDVFTTGATINECSRLLKIAGAKKIICLCIARAFHMHHNV